MPSSFVHADRLKFWEITMEITEMGFLKFATIYGHIGSSGMTHINKAQMTPTILIRHVKTAITTPNI